MKEVKKLGIGLIFLTILTAVILLFSTQASYALDDNGSEVRGRAYSGDNSFTFPSFEILKKIITDDDFLGEEKSLTIELYKDFDFNGNTLTIDDNRTFTFIFNGHFLWSYEQDTLIKVKNGKLILSGDPDPDKHGKIQEPGKDPTFKILCGGEIQADYIDFYNNKKDMKKEMEMTPPSEGGQVYFDDMTKDSCFNHCNFYQCKSEDKGGAIFVNNVDSDQRRKVVFNECLFDGCFSDEGGAVCDDSKKSDLEFNNTTFNDCVSQRGGSIATLENDENVTYNNCSINYCYARRGGAIYNDSKQSNYTFNNTTIKGCYAYPYFYSECQGGAIYSCANYVNYYFHNSTIDTCSAYSKNYYGDGAAIFVDSSHAEFYGFDPNSPDDKSKNSRIINSHAYEGGAIYTSHDTGCGNYVHFKGFNFINNHANCGSIIKNRGSDNIIENCIFQGNSSEGGNKDICDDWGDLKILNCIYAK